MCGWIEMLDVWKQCLEKECSKHLGFPVWNAVYSVGSRCLLIYAVIHRFRRTANLAILVSMSTCQKELTHNTLIYTVEPRQHWDNKWPDYRGVLISGVNVYYKHRLGHFYVSLIQGCPHFRVSSIEGFHCTRVVPILV